MAVIQGLSAFTFNPYPCAAFPSVKSFLWGSGGHPTALIEQELRRKSEGVARSETKPIVPRLKT